MENFVKIKKWNFNIEEKYLVHNCILIYSFLTRNFQFLTETIHSFTKYGGGGIEVGVEEKKGLADIDVGVGSSEEAASPEEQLG